MSAYHETATYAFHLMRVGSCLIRKRDNASVYFQPGDATDDAVTSVSNCCTHQDADQWFDRWCDQFTDHFEAHSDFRKANDLRTSR